MGERIKKNTPTYYNHKIALFITQKYLIVIKSINKV